VTFYAFPKAYWKHVRPTNVGESPFAAVRLRTAAAKCFENVEKATGGHLEDAAGGGAELPPARRTGAHDGGRGGRRVLQRRAGEVNSQRCCVRAAA
jgi:hypothetical protein